MGPLPFMTWLWLINGGGILTTYVSDTWEPILQVTPVVGGQKSSRYGIFTPTILLAKKSTIHKDVVPLEEVRINGDRILTFDPNFLKHPSGRSFF